MVTKHVAVTQLIEVQIDETKFDEKFLNEFKESFYPFNSIDQHAEHLAQLCARGILNNFIEGYGNAKDMGISCHQYETETEIFKG